MNLALIENTEHDVNGDERGKNQHRLVSERIQEGRSGAFKGGLDAGRHVELGFSLIDGLDRVTKGGPWGQVK